LDAVAAGREGDPVRTEGTDLIRQNRVIVWIALATALILAVPLAAMQFTDEVVWTLGDFVVAGALLFGTGLMFVLAARQTGKKVYRVAIGIALAALLLWVWIELAVGLFTNIGS
jgi:hypothetical protein